MGDEVILKPAAASVTGPITTIIWKEGLNIAMEWDGKDIDSYRQFKGMLSWVWLHSVLITIECFIFFLRLVLTLTPSMFVKERGSLNISNGEMTITGLTRGDSGLYTVEINGNAAGSTRLTVICKWINYTQLSEACLTNFSS